MLDFPVGEFGGDRRLWETAVPRVYFPVGSGWPITLKIQNRPLIYGQGKQLQFKAQMTWNWMNNEQYLGLAKLSTMECICLGMWK